jgi:hypothetical protein
LRGRAACHRRRRYEREQASSNAFEHLGFLPV